LGPTPGSAHCKPRVVAVLEEYNSETPIGAIGIVKILAVPPTLEVSEFPYALYA